MATCKEEAGALEEVHFFLFGDKEMGAWVAEAEATLQPAAAEQEEEQEGKQEL